MKEKFNSGKESPKAVYRTALYLRLSQEDGDKSESDSISNQRKLLEDYISGRSEFRLVGEYAERKRSCCKRHCQMSNQKKSIFTRATWAAAFPAKTFF